MEDLPTSLLTQQEQARSRTGEELETFGKHASKLYLGGACGTLTEAVVESVKTAGLGPEQVRRVVEFANTAAYLEKFASAGPEHKVINFEGGPASFPDVIRDLNDGGGGTPMDKAASVNFQDYLLPPPDVEALAAHNLSRFGLVDTKLAQAFAVQEVPVPYEEPLREAADMKDKLAGLYDQSVSELSSLETRYMDLCDLLFAQVKQASLEGVPLGHTLQVLGTANQEPEFFKAAFAMLTPRLVENEVFSDEVAIGKSLQKTAGVGLVNPDHPLVGVYADYCETLVKMAATRDVQSQVEGELDKLTVFIKRAMSASDAGKHVAETAAYLPKAWRAVTGATARASKPIDEFVTSAIGPKAGWAASRAVKYAPHAAALVAGEEVYQRAKANPIINTGSNFVMGRVPYTQQNMIRQYNLQTGL
jgi:hypothetical protein